MTLLAQKPETIQLKAGLIEPIELAITANGGAGLVIAFGHLFLQFIEFDDLNVGVPVKLLLMGQVLAIGWIKAFIKEARCIPAEMVDQKR